MAGYQNTTPTCWQSIVYGGVWETSHKGEREREGRERGGGADWHKSGHLAPTKSQMFKKTSTAVTNQPTKSTKHPGSAACAYVRTKACVDWKLEQTNAATKPKPTLKVVSVMMTAVLTTSHRHLSAQKPTHPLVWGKAGTHTIYLDIQRGLPILIYVYNINMHIIMYLNQ